MAAEYSLSVDIGYNPQQLDAVCDKIENQLSEIEANVKITPQTKDLASRTKKQIKSIVDDSLNELSKLDPAEINSETIEKTFSNYVKEAKNSIKDIVTSVRGSLGDNSELANSLENIFKEVEAGVKGYSSVVQTVVSKSKDLGSVVSIAANLKKEYQQMVKELEELKDLASASQMKADTAAFVGDLDTVEKATAAYSELKKDFKELTNEYNIVLDLGRNAKSTEERLNYEKRLIEVEKERLLVAMKIEAVQSEYSSLKAVNFNSDRIRKELFAIAEGQDVFDDKIKEVKGSLEELAYGVSVVLSKELDLAGIMNAGAINIAARLEITTTKEEMVDKIKEKLLEIQKEINETQNLVVPIKYVITTNEQDTLSNTERRNLEKSMNRNVQGMVGDVVVDAGTIFADIEKRGTDAAESLANQAINTIQGVFDEKKIEVKFNNEEAINSLKQALSDEEMGASIDIAQTLNEANEHAQKLLSYFSDITGELEKQDGILKSEQDITPSKYNTENISQTTKQALEEAQKAVDKLNTFFTQPENQIKVWFDTSDGLKQLEKDIQGEDLETKIDITKSLKKSLNLSTQLVEKLQSIENIDFKSNNIGAIDFANMLSQIDIIAGDLAAIVSRIKEIQDAKLSESVKIDLGDSLKDINNLSDAIVLLAAEIEGMAKANNIASLDAVFDEIFVKVSLIREALDNINVKENVLKSFQNLQAAISVLSDSKLTKFQSFASVIKDLSTLDGKNFGKIFSGLKIGTDKDIENITKISPALGKLKTELDKLDKTSFSGFLSQLDHILKSSEALKALATVVQKTGSNLNKVSQSLSNVDKGLVKDIDKISASLEGLDRESNTQNYLGDYAGRLSDLKVKISEFYEEVERVNNIPEHLFFKSDVYNLEQMRKEIIEMNHQLDESEKKAKSPAKENAIKKLNKFLADSSKLTKEEREQIDALITRLNNPNLSIREFKEIMTTFNEISSNAIRAGRATSSFFDAVRNKLKYGWAQSIAQFFSFYDIIRYVREVSETVTELNSSLIELSKVSDTSIGELYNQFKEFGDIAKQTGGTVNDVIKLTSSWARSGYNLADSKELAKLSSIFQNIGDGLSADQSNEYLVSTLKGFNLEASQAIEIMDKINNVSNNAASSVSNIGEALERSSSAFGAANTSLSESVALVTKANEVLQNPETVGTAFKSLSARLRGSSTELEELGEETTITTSKLRALIQALTGVDIQEDENTFKSIYDILLEIGQEWNNLTDIQQASLSEALFGKRNSQVGFSILNDVERLQEIYALAEDSAGSAMEEQQRYLEGIQYQIDSFKASVETLANDTMSSDFLKGAISGARSLVDALDVVLEKLGAIPVLVGTIGAALSAKGMGITGAKLESTFDFLTSGKKASTESLLTIITDQDKTALMQFNQLLNEGYSYSDAFSSSMLDASKSAQEFAHSFENVDKGIRDVYQEYAEFTDANNELALSQLASTHSLANNTQILKYYNENVAGSDDKTKAFTKSLDVNNHSLAAYIASLNGAQGSLIGYIRFTLAATLRTLAFKAVAMALQTALGMFVGFLMKTAISALDSWIHSTEKAIEKGEEAKRKIDEITSAFKNQQKTIKESAQRFAELSQGIDQLTGRNISLSEEDYQEFLDISNELAEVFPTLSRHYDENNNAIINLDGSVSSIVDSLTSLLNVEQQLANEKILEQAPTILKKVKAEVDDLYENSLVTANDSKTLQNYKDALSFIGVKADVYGVLSGEGGSLKIQDYSLLTKENINKIVEKYGDDVADLVYQLNEINQKATSKYQSLSSVIATWLYSDFAYSNLDEEVRAGIQQVINNLDFSKLDVDTWEDLQKWIDDNVLKVFQDEKYSEPFVETLDLNTKFNNQEVTAGEYQEKLEAFMFLIKDMPDETQKAIRVLLNIDEDGQSQISGMIENVRQQFQNAGLDRSFAETLAKSLKKAELEAIYESDIDWSKIIHSQNALVAIEQIRIKLHELSSEKFEVNLNVDDVKATTDGIKELQSVFSTLYQNNADGKTGVDLAFGYGDIEELKSKLVDLDGEVVDLGDTWTNFFDVMTDGSHSFEEMEEALNEVLTAYATATIDLDNFDKKQQDSLSTQLQLVGVSKESADNFVAVATKAAQIKQEVGNIGLDFAKTTNNQVEALNLLQTGLDAASDSGYDLNNITSEQIDLMLAEGKITPIVAQLLAQYAYQKDFSNGFTIKTSADCDNLIALAKQAGATTESLKKFAKQKARLAELEADLADAQEVGDTALIRNIKKTIDTYTATMDTTIDVNPIKIDTSSFDMQLDRNKAGGKSSGGGGKESDPWKEAYEKELAALDHMHELELISDIKYYAERQRLNDKYFKDNEKYTEEYNKNIEDIYKGFQAAYKEYVDDMSDYWKKSLDANLIDFKTYCSKMKAMLDELHDAGQINDETYYSQMAEYYNTILEKYDMAINAVQRTLKKRMDALSDEKDAVKKDYEARIDVIQKEIDRLNEANDARQKEIDLQKQLYALNRAQNQRPDLVYNSEKGYIYANRTADIQSAEADIAQSKFEMYIDTLEKNIKVLEDEMDDLTNKIDEQINAIQAYYDRWGEIANKYKEAQEDLVAASIFGYNWQKDVLSLSDTMLTDFTGSYLSMQKQQADMAAQAAAAKVAAANDEIDSYRRLIEALNAWKQAQASAAQTSSSVSNASTSNSSKTKVTASTTPIGGGMSAASQAINASYQTHNSQLAAHYTSGSSSVSGSTISAVSKAVTGKGATVTSSSNRRISGYTYGSGTEDAKPGVHEVAETGDEIIRDNYGNAYLAQGHQLHFFEGGERVYNPSETKELLNGKYFSVNSLLPNYQNMLSKMVNASVSPLMNMNDNILSNRNNYKSSDSGKSVVVTIGDIHISEVDNATQLARVIKNQLPNALLQELNKH